MRVPVSTEAVIVVVTRMVMARVVVIATRMLVTRRVIVISVIVAVRRVSLRPAVALPMLPDVRAHALDLTVETLTFPLASNQEHPRTKRRGSVASPVGVPKQNTIKSYI